MAEKETKTEEVEDSFSKHAIVGTAGSVAATITTSEQPANPELPIWDEAHTLHHLHLDILRLARNAEGLSKGSWDEEIFSCSKRHDSAVQAYLESMCKTPFPRFTHISMFNSFINSLSKTDILHQDDGEKTAACMLQDQFDQLAAEWSTPFITKAGSVPARDSDSSDSVAKAATSPVAAVAGLFSAKANLDKVADVSDAATSNQASQGPSSRGSLFDASSERQTELRRRQAELNRRKAEIDNLQVELDNRRVEVKNRQAELVYRYAEISNRQAELENRQAELSRLQNEIDMYY